MKPAVVFIILYAIVFFSSPEQATAQGNLMVTPVRAVFEGQERSTELNIANSGKDTARFVISMVEIRMNKSGTFERITEPDSGQLFASEYIRFFPHSVVLGPNEAQVVKLQVTETNQLTPGEYRSHLYFRAVPDERLMANKNKGKDSSGINVRLVPVFGITIPVIVRIGNTAASVQLTDLSLDFEKGPLLTILFNRSGNASVYGDVTVDYISPQGKRIQVGSAQGLAVYTPNQQRYLHLSLENKPGIDFHTGKLHVTYSAAPPSRITPLAEAELQLK
ncbi:molecular chaperone [Chitinophaga qingshengii]|uniref:Molecular chaperone n=1 Tax=Chitinophaga qingshengii TaxID=1569794 RepID=A0ABR7TNI9_9BACT|nr:molecular chaperone [Chitinophaga qingshengii]MBC9930579.1 molecular chaperone [Chitinophaga qingshengii]